MQIHDPSEFAHTADGVDRAEHLARLTMAGLIETTALANLDTTIASMFLLTETLAHLEVFADMKAKEAIAQVRHMVSERAVELNEEQGDEAGLAGQAAPAATGVLTAPVLH